MTRATPPMFLAILRAALVQVRGDLRPAFVGAGIFTAFLPALLILWLSRLNLIGGPGTDSLTVAGFVGSWSCMIVIQVGAETYMDRVGGALLRVRVLPHGPMVWAIGKTISTAAILVVSQVILLVLGMFLLNGFPLGWGQLIPVVGLAIVASLAAAPIGFLSGAVARGSNLQMLSYVLVFALLGTSGAAIPLVTLPGWVQVIQQALPFYWSGHLTRWALVGDPAWEVGGSFQPLLAFCVLTAWVLVGFPVAAALVRRGFRKESIGRLSRMQTNIRSLAGG